MDLHGLVQQRPYRFCLLLLLVLIVANAAALAVSRSMGVPVTFVLVFSELLVAALLVLIVFRLGWWSEIGFTRPERPGALWLFAPALLLPLGNLTFGLAPVAARELLLFALLAALSGFVEEVIFRGLMLRALLVRGERAALLGTSGLFGVAHAGSLAAGSDPLYVVLQIAYSLAIGFSFGAMALRGRLLWPLIAAHGLGNFIAFINVGERFAGHLATVVAAYIVAFVGYGLFLVRASSWAAEGERRSA